MVAVVAYGGEITNDWYAKRGVRFSPIQLGELGGSKWQERSR